MERAAHKDDNPPIDPADDAWIRQRSAAAPLAFGVVGLVLSPLLLGLFAGPIGIRTGLDLWRGGTRRATVVVGIAASVLAIVLSTVAALLWGSVLSTVLLGRDAMRETESWRGREVDARVVTAVAADGPREVSLRPAEGRQRLLLVAVMADDTTSQRFLDTLAEALPRHRECSLLLVNMGGGPDFGDFARRAGIEAPVIANAGSLPPPLDRISGVPTIVVLDTAGRIESALVGSRPPSEVERLLSGPGAPASSTSR